MYLYINMKNLKILEEKLKYLIMSEGSRPFEFTEIDFDILTHNNIIESYFVFVTFDYYDNINSDIESFCYNIKNMNDRLRTLITKYVLTPEGKIVLSSEADFLCSGGDIFNINFELDDKHIFGINFNIILNP